jgi:hypothetical protein
MQSRVEKITDFYSRAQAGLGEAHHCTTTELSDGEEAEVLDAYNAYYATSAWFDDFVDSPWCVVAGWHGCDKPGN